MLLTWLLIIRIATNVGDSFKMLFSLAGPQALL